MHEGNIFYTLQDFLVHSEGVTYVVIVTWLLCFVAFYRFLVDRDSKE